MPQSIMNDIPHHINFYHKADILKEIILEELGIDVMNKRSMREIVDARKIYSYILQETGQYGCSLISKSLQKNHATILFYWREMETLLLIDIDIKSSYNIVKEAYQRKIEKGELSLMTRLELEQAHERLRDYYHDLRLDYLDKLSEIQKLRDATY